MKRDNHTFMHSTVKYFCSSTTARDFSVRAFLLFGLIFGTTAEALNMTKAEYQLLPAYCRNQGNVASNYYQPDNESQWRSRLGKNHSHIHHYCWGMVSLSRSYKSGQSAAERKHKLNTAISDFIFTIERSTSDFVLLPEIYTKVGEAYLGLREYKNAENAFQKAWEIDPTYWPPYVWWSQQLLKQGKAKEALMVAEEGKKNAPDSKALDKLIKEIQGTSKASQK